MPARKALMPLPNWPVPPLRAPMRLDAVVDHHRAVVARLPAMHEDAAIGAVGDRVRRDLQPGGLNAVEAGFSRARDRAALDAAADAFEGKTVATAAEELAIVDDEMGHALEIAEALRIVGQPAVGAIEDEAGEFDMVRFLGKEEMSVAAIEDARRARHAGEPQGPWQRHVGDDIVARRQEDRRAGRAGLFQKLGEDLALVVHARRGGGRDPWPGSSPGSPLSRCWTARPRGRLPRKVPQRRSRPWRQGSGVCSGSAQVFPW